MVDISIAQTIGLAFDVNGRDAMVYVFVYLASTFGVAGFLFGYILEIRKREKASAALIQSQFSWIQNARQRLSRNEKLAALGQLAATISHEVRNPLAIIRSATQNLSEMFTEDQKDAKANTRFILEEIDRLTRVTASILSFAKPLTIVRKPVNIDLLLERTHLLANAFLDDHELALQKPPAPSPVDVWLDEDLTCQLLLGLIANAAAASPSGESILLDAHVENDTIEFSVIDHGKGVSDELKTRIFEPFFSTTKEGTGLGLPIIKKIVDAHNGDIRISKTRSGGACFTVSLPYVFSEKAVA